VIEKFDCEELLPLAKRIIRLSRIKEVVGYIPEHMIPYDYEELECLLILQEEQALKMEYDIWRSKKDSDRQQEEIERKSQK